VVYFCSGGFADRHTSNVVVDRGQRRKRKSFFAWEFGWTMDKKNPVWFWFNDTGLFVPLLICRDNFGAARIIWFSRRLLLFYLPFTLCFVIQTQ